MKSSCRVITPSSAKSFSVWQPDNLDMDNEVSAASPVEEVASIFQPEETQGVTDTTLVHNSHVFKGNAVDFAVCWVPGEMDIQPSGDDLEWDFVGSPVFASKSSISRDNHAFGVEAEIRHRMKKAQREARQIIQQAQQEAAEILAQAREGAQKTIAEGYHQGWTVAKQEAGSVLESVNTIFEEVSRWRDEMITNGEEDIVNMVKEIARLMFGDGVALDHQALQMNYNRVINKAKTLGDLKIFINPGDAEVLDPSWREFQVMITGNKVQIIPSEKITRGGCFIQGQDGAVDARVETQLDGILEALNEDDDTMERNR